VHLSNRIPLLITLAMSLISAPSFAQDLSEAAVAKRIAPVGSVYLDGGIVTAQQSTVADEPAGPRTGEKIYNTYCVACHATGAAGAPLKGNVQAWQPRIAQGKNILIKHATEGFNAMPARGTCADCSDDEIAATVEFLIQGI
jgi:cytochrome c5